jgi:ABC-type glycerol-3-phosphate transport system substrate-binding protein
LAQFLDADLEFDRRDLWSVAWETAIYSDTVWSMPFSLSHVALYYNRSLLARAGLDPDAPPTTWKELEVTTAALTRDSNRDSIVDQ